MRPIFRTRFSILVCMGVLFLFLNASISPQKYDPQKARILKSELWSLLEKEGIVTAIDPQNLTEDQQKTLASIKKVSDYPIYTMTYYGDYGFDEFLKVGHPAGSLSSGIGEGCSCFAALNKQGNKIYGRNLDLTNLYPVLILFTDSPKGYAAVSIHGALDIELYLGDPSNEQYIQWVLEYPYWPFDGMNEYGVSISGLNVEGESVYDPDKLILNRYEIRRLVLEHARNIDEALVLINKYNCSTSESVHYLLSDAHGNSAVVEYYDGQVQDHRNVEPWQVATNFMLKGRAPGLVLGDCLRYAVIYESLLAEYGLVSRWSGMNILGLAVRHQVPAPQDALVHTVYSGIYDLTEGWLEVCPGGEYGNKERFKLDMVNDLSILKAGTSPGVLEFGDMIKASAIVKNLSPRPSKKTYVDFYLSMTKKVGDDSIYLGRKRLKSLGFKTKKTVRFNKTFKKAVEPGAYYFVAVVDGKGLNNDPKLRNNSFAVKKKLIIE